MERVIIYLIFIIVAFIPGIMKRVQKGQNKQTPLSTVTKSPKAASAMPHKHKKEGAYDTFSKKVHDTNPGAMPHKHETGHYTSMSDASKLPPGYILLNGEAVRVADLENK